MDTFVSFDCLGLWWTRWSV